jgi:DNA polymerase-1
MLIKTEEQWRVLLDRIRNGPAVTVYDLETTGLEPFKRDRLIGVAVLVPGKGKAKGRTYYAPFRHLKGRNLPIRALYRLAPYLADPSRLLVGFNLKFDVHFTEAERMGVHNQLMDVMLMAHLANENEMSFALKRLGAKYVDPDAAQSEKDLLQILKDRKLKKGDMQYLSPEELAPYAEQDVRLTWQLGDLYTQNLEQQGLGNLLPGVNKYLEAVTAMERRGVLVDPQGCARELARARKSQGALYRKMKAMVGHEFNPNSVPQLRKILGQKATDKKALKKSKHPLAPYLVQSRAWVKAAGTFYQGFLDSMDSNRRVHPNLALHGTISGRLACRDPNLQALPKQSGKIYRVRELILAPPGYVLMSWDWEQAELRLMAHYTKDPFLVDAFRKGKDIHQETADRLDVSRDKAKRTNFSVIYGIGYDTLAEELSMPRGEAVEYLNNYHRLIPGVRRLYQSAQRIAERDYKIPMWTGRLRHYREEDYTYRALSNLIQGGVAEMMRVAITSLHDLVEGTAAYQVLQVHDEVLFEIPEGREAEWAVEIKRIMENFGFDVPIVAEGRMGYSWGTDEMRPIVFDGDTPTVPKLGRRGT